MVKYNKIIGKVVEYIILCLVVVFICGTFLNSILESNHI